MNNRQIILLFSHIFFVTLILNAGITTVHASTSYILSDDPTGGDSTLIGIWDPVTKTCTLTQDVYGEITIHNPGITLDGAGHSIIGTGTGTGVINQGEDVAVDSVTIKDVTIRDFDVGVLLGDISNFHNIIGCNILNNNIGIRSVSNGWCTFKGNTIEANSIGLDFGGGNYNNIIDNTISDNVDGIRTKFEFSYSLISGNMISSNSGNGIYGSEFCQSKIIDNTISNNGNGIYLEGSDTKNIISNNTVSKCGIGIYFLYYSYGNDVFDNLIQENHYGIESFIEDYGIPNRIHNNCLNKNLENANGYEFNNFYSNYYSDYTGLDTNTDGIGDAPYKIPGGAIDNSPLMKCPFESPLIFPEFPTVVLPIATVLGMLFIFQYRRS